MNTAGEIMSFEFEHGTIKNRKKIPIEAFFYLIGSNSGEREAKMYQSDYAALTGEIVPIVGIRLPHPNDPNLIVKD